MRSRAKENPSVEALDSMKVHLHGPLRMRTMGLLVRVSPGRPVWHPCENPSCRAHPAAFLMPFQVEGIFVKVKKNSMFNQGPRNQRRSLDLRSTGQKSGFAAVIQGS